jgi:uncharacterized membrane protein YphA (DoxX/SURF4 family)
MLSLFFPSVLITAMFLLSGLEKIYFYPRGPVKFAKKVGISLTLSHLILIAVIILEIIAPLAITAYTFTGLNTLVPFFKLSIIGLVIFTVLATFIYHNPLFGRDSYYAFITHMSVIGGLLALYVCS